ncbi:TatD family hydrolase [Alkalimonas amylolytica]|uniref:TatD DNase family protein n=1 Tax=Alkalimonas amylolytica TaxID=152573 RepID=A0A1H4ELJ4_ALKAM|nr:TatD family hydrolase [Alkalimonas amylolytica]SEA85709.1 TatD DNase family protein [Alkalimonas amylolytica]
MAWFDLGVNLFSSQFDHDRAELLKRAQAAGVEHWLLIASDLREAQQNIAWCQQHPVCFSTAGVHPHQADQVSEGWQQQLRQLAKDHTIVAVGECGLDFNRNFSSEAGQLKVFSEQLSLAKELQLPVYLHERDAFHQQYDLLQEHQIQHGIAHCFTGNTEQLKAYLDLGLYIGITGWLCDERRNQELVAALHFLPLDRICLETDAPYLLPRNLAPKPKSRRNEPAYLPAIAEQLARLKGVPLQQVQEQCRLNSLQLLNRTGVSL